jgi:cyclophilin family peptidyl-prolyl cis-trans isomerase
MKKVIILLAVCLLAISACKKQETTEAPAPNTPTASQEEIVEISTSFGTMHLWLYKQTPLHRKNFLALTDSGYFNGSTFHRIVKDFVIQGGDPNSKDADTTNDGSGGPGYTIPAEIKSTLKHVYGAVGAARTNNPAKASSGSQFYIVTNKAGTASLNNNYTVFGQVIGGLDTAYTISVQPKNSKDRPYANIEMQLKIIKLSAAEIKTRFNFDVGKADSL